MIREIWDDICPLRAPAGGEETLAQQIETWLRNEGDLRRDRTGNLIFERPGPGPRRLVLAALDEATFALAGVNEGRASFALYGCLLPPQAMRGQAVRVGDDLAVVSGPDEAGHVRDLWLECYAGPPGSHLGTWATGQTCQGGWAFGRACGSRLIQAAAIDHARSCKGALTLVFAASTGVGDQGIAPLLRDGAFDEAVLLTPLQHGMRPSEGALLVRHMPGMASDLNLSARLAGSAKEVAADARDNVVLARPVRRAGIPCVALGLPVGYRTGPWEIISFQDGEHLLASLGKL